MKMNRKASPPLPSSPPSSPPSTSSPTLRAHSLHRGALLLLILLAFAHVVIGLGVKDFWWDESLSLQRAEQDWLSLLRGVLLIKDGYIEVPTIDQHPFFSFLLQGILVRVAGTSEFVLRFVAAAAATLLAPALYVLARVFARRGIVPASAPLWTMLLAAFSPFYLWYGQEARPYTLWALLAVLSTYLLLTSLEPPAPQSAASTNPLRWRRIGYVLTLAMFVTTHYYAVFMLPVHALIMLAALWKENRRVAILSVAGLLTAAGIIGGLALWMVLRQGGGGNFPSVSLGVLLPDLLNAFTLGLSVNIDDVRWLNAIFAALALAGAGWMLRSRATLRAGGWIVPLLILTPILALLVGMLWRNIYMNARHMSLISGPFLLLVGTGLALVWSRWRWVGGALAVLLLAGFAFSTVNYYTREEYAKDDFSSLGQYMDGRMMPGDVILYYPPSSWRVFEYYAPMHEVRDAIAGGTEMAIYGVPRLDESVDTFAWLTQTGEEARRVWVLKSGTHPYYDLEGEVEAWLTENFLQVRNAQFFSHSSLRAQLYLPTVPVDEGTPAGIPNATTVEFGNLLRIAGYALEPGAPAALPSPVTLHWQVISKPEQRYKYILELMQESEQGLITLGRIEREPYEGDIPTTFWDPDRTIREYIELTHAPVQGAGALYLALQIYDVETQEKLPVSADGGFMLDADGYRVLLPLPAEVRVTP